MVFPDIHPLKPVHLLIIPKKHLGDLLMMNDKARPPSPESEANGGQGLMIKLTKVIQKMIKEQKLENKGYRVVINGGGAQIIDHLHLHLMGPLGKAAEMSA